MPLMIAEVYDALKEAGALRAEQHPTGSAR